MPTIAIDNLALSLNAEFASDPRRIGTQGFYAALNVQADRGTVKKRPGLQSVISGLTGTTVLIAPFVDSSENSWIIICTTTKQYSYNPTTLTLTDITHAGYSASITAPVRGVSFVGKFFMSTPGALYYWDGVAATFQTFASGSPESALDLLNFFNHLIIANVVTSGGVLDPWQVAWSDFGNGTNLTTGDATQIEVRDNADFITGLGNFIQNGVLYKSDSLYIVSFIGAPQFYAFDRRHDSIGCIATGSIQDLPIGCGALWRDDYYIFNGLSPQGVGGNYRRNFFASTNLSFIQAAFSCKDVPNETLYLFLPDASFTSATPVFNCHVWNWRYNTWNQYDYVPGGGQVSAAGSGMFLRVGRTWNQATYAFSASPYRFSDGSTSAFGSFLLGGATSGKIYQVAQSNPIYTDDGTPYDSYFQLGLIDFGQPYPARKQVTKWDVMVTPQASGSLAVSEVSSDDGITLTTAPTQSLAMNASTPQAWEIPAQKTAVYHAMRVDDQAGTVAWEVRQIVADVQLAGAR